MFILGTKILTNKNSKENIHLKNHVCVLEYHLKWKLGAWHFPQDVLE